MESEPMMVKTKRKTSKATWIGLTIITGLIVLSAWDTVVPYEYQTEAPQSFSEACKRSPIELPASARDVQMASRSAWMMYVDYVRFEASSADCELHAKKMLPFAEAKPFPSASDSPETLAFEFPPTFPTGRGGRKLDWFDVQNITNGVRFGEGGPGEAVIYVDRDRGIFYYWKTWN